MSREKYMRRAVMEALGDAGLHPVAVENPICPGTPDVNHAHGWLELKHLDAWPKRETTFVDFPTWSQEQRLWFKQRLKAGGRVDLLVRISRDEWFLVAGDVALWAIGCLVRTELVGVALRHWPRGLDRRELAELCSTPRI